MTAIIGIQTAHEIWLGCDSAGVSGDAVELRPDRKVFTRRGVAFGVSGSFRLRDLLATVDLPTAEHAGHAWIRDSLAPPLRDQVARAGLDMNGCDVLVATPMGLFAAHSDWQVALAAAPKAGRDRVIACGSGAPIARGALYASDGRARPSVRIRTALAAAERYSGGVRGPFHVLKIIRKPKQPP